MTSYNLVHERNHETNEVYVVGIEIISMIDGNIVRKGFYNGIQITIEEALTPSNRMILGIEDSATFYEKYKYLKAVGIIYFPTTKTYGFLESHDVVFEQKEEFDWICNQIKEQKVTKDNSAELYENIDLDDPMIELCNIPMKRSRVSER